MYQVKIRLHHHIARNKILKTRSHVDIFRYFLPNIYLIMKLYVKITIERNISTIGTSHKIA